MRMKKKKRLLSRRTTMIPTLKDMTLEAKRVFLRVDYNVPLHGNQVGEAHRIDSTLPTLNFILARAKTVLLAAHLGRPGGKRDPQYSLEPVRAYLQSKLSQPVVLAPDCVGPEVERLAAIAANRIILLENLRFHPEEEDNEVEFSRALA